jgi:hypothetical protein
MGGGGGGGGQPTIVKVVSTRPSMLLGTRTTTIWFDRSFWLLAAPWFVVAFIISVASVSSTYELKFKGARHAPSKLGYGLTLY